MSRPVVVLAPDATVGDVHKAARRIHHFPIARGDLIVGFVCTCDLIGARPETPVLPLAWHHPATVSPGCTISDAALLLLMHGVGSLLVMDPSGLRGIVTADDLRAVGPDVAQLLEPARCTACGAGEHLRPGPDGKSICAYCKLHLGSSASFGYAGRDEDIYAHRRRG